ncbi:hypothetical protein Pcac1_g27021 [Phytophthora cactorum]|nr:hypothetical protein Pcac1_g27021 [Phytophthora cactorum]
MACAKKFLTAEDLKMALNIFCCVYGIGTLGMPGNFSRAGPVLAVVGMAFMAFANVYASVAICRVMLLAPKSVKTYSDLGEWCMGKWGRWLSVVSQMAVSSCAVRVPRVGRNSAGRPLPGRLQHHLLDLLHGAHVSARVPHPDTQGRRRCSFCRLRRDYYRRRHRRGCRHVWHARPPNATVT